MNPASKRSAGFTLVELMVSVSLIALVALILVAMTNSTVSTWKYTTGRIEQFRGANSAFESITRNLSQATLNTYWDYNNPNAPSKYLRQSDLRFITGKTEKLAGTAIRRPTQAIFFQAPLGFVDKPADFSGLDNLINTWGYYVEFRDDALTRPSFISPTLVPARHRYRLMELMQPSNSLSVYSYTSGVPNYTGKTWFTNAMVANPSPAHVLSENVIALVLMPRLSKKEETATGKTLSADYTYDSTVTGTDPDINPKNQLPPIVQVTVVAIDEASATRIANGASRPSFDASLDSLFLKTDQFDADIATLQDTLQKSTPPINYRVFTSSVSIRGAKWSRK